MTDHGNQQAAREWRLFDSQWLNIVNHADCYRGMDKSEAIALAVRLTEKAMAANAADEIWPKPRTKGAYTPLPTPPDSGDTNT